jgi:hypothetical protein
MRARMLEMVADRHGMTGIPCEVWIDAVVAKLKDVGVVTVRDFVTTVLLVNRRLARAGHSQLHEPTLQAMLEEAHGMMFGPDDKVL